MPWRSELRARPGRRRTDPVLRPLRAPRPPLLRQGLDRLRRPRADRRHQQADQARSRRDAALRRPGADDPRHRRHPRVDAPPARRRGLSRGAPPVHRDAGRARARAHDPDHRLARYLRGGAEPASRVLRRQRDRRPAVTDPAWGIEPLFAAPTHGRRRGGALPADLAERYGADLSIELRDDRPTIVSNFVSTIDGVVAFDREGRTGGLEVSGHSAPDRFLMGLVRATSDAVLNGAGTVRSGAHGWTPASLHPASAAAYAEWRQALGLTRQPAAVVVTGSGSIDPDHPGLHDPDVPVVLVSTDDGASRLG